MKEKRYFFVDKSKDMMVRVLDSEIVMGKVLSFDEKKLKLIICGLLENPELLKEAGVWVNN
jgi:hypothetical protein